MAVFQVNRRRIRAVNLTAVELESKRQEILTRLTDCLRGEGRALQLVVEKKTHAELTAAREVFFEARQQGGERGVGQQVLLILERATPTIPWGLKLAALPNTQPLLTNFSDKLQLSKKAKNFLFDHRGRLRVVSVNYRGIQQRFTTEQLKQFMSESLLLALWLQVADPPSDGIEEASFFGDEPHAKELTNNAADPLGIKKVHSKVSPKANENENKIQPSLEHTEKSSGVGKDHDNSLDKNSKSAKGEVAISAEDGDLTTPDNSLSEWEDNALEGTLDSSHERAAKLEDYDSFEEEPEPFSTNEDLDEFKEVSKEDLPEEGNFAELEGSETREARLEEGDPVTMSDTNEDKVSNPKDVKSSSISKIKKISTKERKKRAGNEETMMAEDYDVENTTIDKDDINHEEIDKNVEPSNVEDPMISNLTGDVPLMGAQLTSAEIAMQLGHEAGIDGSDSSKQVENKSYEDLLSAPLNRSASKTAVSDKDVPLVDSLKTTAEIAMEVVGGVSSTTSISNTFSSSSEKPIAGNVPVSLTQLLETPPLKFDNKVIANKFDGTALELLRPSTEVPWNIKIAFVGGEVLLSKLPQVADEKQDHPYLKYLGVMPDGNVRCAVESMNGVDLLMASKLEKAKLMETVKKCTKLSMVLKVLR
ncbi:unnamed protein product [Phytomonas sp. Hart1]|nr:unnamed protein product [Phytomonas sp. Hart1]|eukprot:CCW71594.1 unnamed protein product [Phytomonas sp. isolate Hart1]